MKLSVLPFITLFLLPIVTAAQNSVTVIQKGNNNSVTIKQSPADAKKSDCLDSLKTYRDENIIAVKKPGSDTLLTDKGIQYYFFSNIFNGKNKLETYQKGKENTLYVLLPDTTGKVNKLNSRQSGHENAAFVQLSNTASNVNITQKGKRNTFTLNPCSSVAADKKKKKD